MPEDKFSTISTLLPKKLDKDDASYQSVIELDEVLYNAKRLGIRNIAVTGPYGSGKSSVLLTLREDYERQREYLPISLATLQGNDEEQDKSVESGENPIEELNRKIEYSILQQIIYREEIDTVRNSRLRRIIHIPSKELRNLSLKVVSTILAFFILFEPTFARVETFAKYLDFGNIINCIFDSISLLWLLRALFLAIQYFINAYSNSKLNKLNLKDGEIEIKDNSIFNKYLDEILYFFQVTKYNVVIFEDLDRFGTSKIFLKLRELSQLINESKIVGRHITFIYAVKDDIFNDEERTKFFDYIITVIPVMNSSNAKDILKKELEKQNLNNDGITDNELAEIAFFIRDRRILNNIVNEYRQYRNKLCISTGQKINKTKLLAMIVYKNYYPKDFSKLHRREGKVYGCINSKNEFIDLAARNIEEQLSLIQDDIKVYEENKHLKITELRQLFLIALKESIGKDKMFKIKIDNQFYDFKQISSDETLFNRLLSLKGISYLYYHYSSHQEAWTEVDCSKIDARHNISKRIQLLNLGVDNLREKYKCTQKQKTHIKSKKLSELIKEFGIGQSEVYKQLELEDMMDVFIRLGYIDEDYYDYISFFYDGMVTSSDRELLISIKRDIQMDPDRHIDKIENFVKELADYMFESDAILNNDILDFISCNELYQGQFEHFMMRLEKEESPLSFLAQYFLYGKNVVRVFSHFIAWNNESAWNQIIDCHNADERENLICGFLQNVTTITPQVRFWLNSNYSFIAQHIDDISLEACLRLVQDSIFIDLCNDSVGLLDAVIEYNSYAITPDNLLLITRQLTSGNEESTTSQNLNITRIHSTNNPNFIQYIDENIADVVPILTNELKDDSPDALLFILNLPNDSLQESEKTKYLTGQRNKIADFSEIKNDEMHTVAIKTNIIQATWGNVSTYYQEAKKMSAELKDYILQNEKELSNHKVDDTITNGMELFMTIFGTDDFPSSCIERLNGSFDFEFDGDSALESLSTDRLKLLISLDKIPFTQSNLVIINKTEVLNQYLLKNSQEFSQHLGWKYNITASVAITLLSSEKFDESTKVDIIGLLNLPTCTSSAKLANLVIKHPVNMLLSHMDYTALIAVLKMSDDSARKIVFAIDLIKGGKLTEAQITEVISTLGNQYENLCERGKRPKIAKTSNNENLLRALLDVKYISSYKSDTEKDYIKVVNHQKR